MVKTTGDGLLAVFETGSAALNAALDAQRRLDAEPWAEIVTTLATALDFQFQDSGNESEQLLNYLRHKQMLLVMDNFEHILEDQLLLGEISRQAAGVKLLVTSRERLPMRGGQLLPLGGLEMAQTADSAGESPSAELFLNIARRTAPDFQLQEGDAEHLQRICRLVEGMPLGLELAASWVGLLPLSKIATEIEQSLDLLAVEHSDVPRRHRSMAAALEASWRRLTPEQQRAFQELTVFRGGFKRTAAVEVVGATLPLLVALANKSWLTYDRQKDRYYIHELLRQYGAGKLSADPVREQDVRERHSAFFCGFLQDREADWCGARQQRAASEVRNDVDNVQRAWRWAAKKGDSLLLAQGLQSLCRFYQWEGRQTDGQLACHLASESLAHFLDRQPAEDAQRLALRSLVLAWASEFVGEVAQKEELLAESQQLLDMVAAGDHDIRREQAFLFMMKAYSAENNNLEEALKFAGLGLTIFRELSDLCGEAEVLGEMGTLSLFHGDYEDAVGQLRDSLHFSRQLEDTVGIARATGYLSIAVRNRGDFAESVTLAQQRLELNKQLGNRYQVWTGLGLLAIHSTWAGNFTAARKFADQAVDLARDLGRYPNPWSLNTLAHAMIHLGHYGEAKRVQEENLALARQRGLFQRVGWAAMQISMIALLEGDLVAANDYLLESTSLLAEMRHMHESLPQAVLSYVLRARGEGRSARHHLANSLQAGIEGHTILPLMKCLPSAALLAADNGDHLKAVELYGLAQEFDYIRNFCWFADVACNELDEVRASLPTDVAAAAEARGRELDVWETAEALLRELDGH